MHAKFGQYSACLIVRRVSAGHAELFLQPPGFGENTKDEVMISSSPTKNLEYPLELYRKLRSH